MGTLLSFLSPFCSLRARRRCVHKVYMCIHKDQQKRGRCTHCGFCLTEITMLPDQKISKHCIPVIRSYFQIPHRGLCCHLYLPRKEFPVWGGSAMDSNEEYCLLCQVHIAKCQVPGIAKCQVPDCGQLTCRPTPTTCYNQSNHQTIKWWGGFEHVAGQQEASQVPRPTLRSQSENQTSRRPSQPPQINAWIWVCCYALICTVDCGLGYNTCRNDYTCNEGWLQNKFFYISDLVYLLISYLECLIRNLTI